MELSELLELAKRANRTGQVTKIYQKVATTTAKTIIAAMLSLVGFGSLRADLRFFADARATFAAKFKNHPMMGEMLPPLDVCARERHLLPRLFGGKAEQRAE